MNINILSKPDCEMLIDRIRDTLQVEKPKVLKNIRTSPSDFRGDDNYIFKGLCRAILTRQANWASVKKILPALKVSLFNYNVNSVAALTDSDIGKLFAQYKSKVKARFLEDELLAIRNNARVFQQIMSTHGSVCTLIKSYLPAAAYDPLCKCYVRPADAPLIKCFTDPNSPFKLRSVGLATCCEFFNNIGIDEFKPDTHTIAFLNRINLNRAQVRASRKPEDIRKTGITIAEALGKPRKYVDSYIWHFCAEDEGEICTGDDPKCYLCKLKTDKPEYCKGFPNRSQIVNNPWGATKRFQECNLTRKETHEKMQRAGLNQENVERVLDQVYGPKPVRWRDIEAFIGTNPYESAQAMKQSGSSREQAYRDMQKAGLARDDVEGILRKVYESETDSE